jgi:hypothetical protein
MRGGAWQRQAALTLSKHGAGRSATILWMDRKAFNAAFSIHRIGMDTRHPRKPPGFRRRLPRTGGLHKEIKGNRLSIIVDTFALFLLSLARGSDPSTADRGKRIDMRTLIGAACAVLTMVGLAFAAEAEGKIKSIDREGLTITLDDGKSYKLPGEFDMDSIKEGMEVLLAYDQIGGQNLITDMQLSE